MSYQSECERHASWDNTSNEFARTWAANFSRAPTDWFSTQNQLDRPKILYNDHVIYSSYKFGIFGRNPVPHIYASPRVLPYIAERFLEFRRQPVYSGSITIFVSPIEKDTGYSILLTEMDYGQRLKFEKTSCDDREFFDDRDL